MGRLGLVACCLAWLAVTCSSLSPGLATWQWGVLTVLALLLYTKLQGIPAPLGLPQHSPHWLAGNSYDSSCSMVQNVRNFHEAMKHHKMSIFWMFWQPEIYIADLELIKKILITDSDHFYNFSLTSPDYIASVGLQLGLFDSRDEEHKSLKRLITPAFSGPRIKKLAVGMNRVGRLLVDHLKAKEQNGEKIDIQQSLDYFSMTCIADVGFGSDANCFTNPDNAFLKYGKGLFDMWRFMFLLFVPILSKWLRISLLNPKKAKHFENLCQQIVEQRLASKDNTERKDILDNLIRAREENPLMTPVMMFKTMIQFFTDGFEGLSRIASSIIYLITVHPDVQEKMVEEMELVLGDREDITEDDTRNLEYLDQVISEGLRMNPVFFTGRECGKAYKVPGTELTIPAGAKIFIPLAALHYDPDIWGDPETFRPERFSPENRGNIPSAGYLPFGGGPRHCVGYNLMKLELKVLLCHLLRNFRISPRGQMKMPLVFHKTEAFLLEGGVHVDIAGRD